MIRTTTRFPRSIFLSVTAALMLTAACDDPDQTADAALLADLDPAAVEVLEQAAVADDETPAMDIPALDELAQSTPTTEAKALCRILPLGDSITYGWNGNWGQQSDPSGNYLGGYRSHLVYGMAVSPSPTVGTFLMVGVRQDNSPPWLVNWGQSWHAGAPGFTNLQLADAVDQGASNVNPDIILLHAGTNDILSGPAPKAANAIGTLYKLLERLRLKNPAATVLLAKIIPLAGPLNTEVIAYNANLDTVAANLRGIGQKVWTVDHNTNFPVATLEDGIHPNWTGYQNMAARWRYALDVVGCW